MRLSFTYQSVVRLRQLANGGTNDTNETSDYK